MPSVSMAQHNLMLAVANNPKFAAKTGIPQKVGKEFAAADKAKRHIKSGSDAAEDDDISPPKKSRSHKWYGTKGKSE